MLKTPASSYSLNIINCHPRLAVTCRIIQPKSIINFYYQHDIAGRSFIRKLHPCLSLYLLSFHSQLIIHSNLQEASADLFYIHVLDASGITLDYFDSVLYLSIFWLLFYFVLCFRDSLFFIVLTKQYFKRSKASAKVTLPIGMPGSLLLHTSAHQCCMVDISLLSLADICQKAEPELDFCFCTHLVMYLCT